MSENRGVSNWEGIDPFYTDQDGSFSPEKGEVVRSWTCPWDTKERLIAELIGYPYTEEVTTTFSGFNGPYQVLRRHLPEQIESNWRGFGDEKFLYCVNASYEPLGGGGEIDSSLDTEHLYRKYELAIVRAVFQTLPYQIKTLEEIDDERPSFAYPEIFRYMRWSGHMGGSYITQEHAQWVYDTGSPLANLLPVGTKTAIYEPEGRVNVEWYDVLKDLFDYERIDNMLGKTNSSSLITPRRTYPPESLIFVGYDDEPKTSTFGQEIVNVKYEFLHKPTNVNKRLSPGANGSYVYVCSKTDRTKRMVEQADLSGLFQAYKVI